MAGIIQIFITGGTFDKEYNYITGELYFDKTHLHKMFDRGRSTLDIDTKTLMMIDSLEMTNEDRKLIVKSCKETSSNNVVITHGTDTMVLTASKIAEADIKGKTIIITGALVPYAFGSSSDGFFNLGAALAYAQVLPPGVYITMNGKYFNWDNVKKNKETGYFEDI